jgi:hypothetical protein|tara:strand:- start:153 stop:314 length:162 start_codon:yes stop_codon:yes gene_type:complete
MPTVTYTCPVSGEKMTKKYPNTATGKAQAGQKAIDMKGKVKNNPGYGMEKENY